MEAWKDGYYHYHDVKHAMNEDFTSEKELCDYIESHMVEFCHDCLEINPKEYSREFPINGHSRKRGRGNRRIDFMIRSTDGEVIAIECKAPTFIGELSYAIGQSLSYIALLEVMEIKVDRFIILSTKIDSALPLTIKRFNLPIDFICFDKAKFLKLIKICQRQKEIGFGS